MVNNEFLMNAYPAQRSHRANIFFDQFSDFQKNAHKYLCSVIQLSVNYDQIKEYKVEHY